MTSPVVFISYSHDSDAHRDRVLALSERLRQDGIETRLDQYVQGTPAEGWPRWMLDRLDEADFVLVVCTETYYRRFRGHEEPGKGKGGDWEGALITQEFYDARSGIPKFVPAMLADDQEAFIPEPFRGHTHYSLTSEASYQALYDFLLGQAGVEPGELGETQRRARRRGEPLSFDRPKAAVETSRRPGDRPPKEKEKPAGGEEKRIRATRLVPLARFLRPGPGLALIGVLLVALFVWLWIQVTPRPVALETLQGEFQKVVDAELKKPDYVQIRTGHEVFVVRDDDYEALRDTLSALLGVPPPKNSFFDIDTRLAGVTAPYLEEFRNIGELTVDVRLGVIKTYNQHVDRAVAFLGQLAAVEIDGEKLREILGADTDAMDFLQALETRTNVDPFRLLDPSDRQRQLAIEGVPQDQAEALDLRKVWEETAENSPIKQRIRTVRAASDTVRGLTDAAMLAGVSPAQLEGVPARTVSEITGSLESAVASLGQLQETLTRRTEAIEQWVQRLLEEAKSISMERVTVVPEM